jgi:hypothetical protein
MGLWSWLSGNGKTETNKTSLDRGRHTHVGGMSIFYWHRVEVRPLAWTRRAGKKRALSPLLDGESCRWR